MRTTHIIESYFECGGYDHRLIKGGISVYIWNLSRAFRDRGHRVSVVTPAHGQLDYLRERYGAELLDYQDEYTLPLVLDPQIWPGFPGPVETPLRTTAARISLEGIDIYVLSNDYLDRYPDTFYPPYDAKGSDLSFFKPVAFQVDSVRFIRRHFAAEPAVVHLHEPFYHYLVPAALRSDPTKRVVSTVQSNMPIAKMVYRPETERLLELLECEADLDAFTDPGPRTEAELAMRQYMPRTHLFHQYAADHVALFPLVARYSDLVDFLSPGQRDFYAGFDDTPFEALFATLPAARTVRDNAHKSFVGGCAISDSWLAADTRAVDRDTVLGKLGLDPALPTFYHNARYAPHHKGQVELLRAVDRVLSEGLAANFVVRCIAPAGIGDPAFHEAAERHRARLHLEWETVDETLLFDYAVSSDFCLFPSKFEMDTFLIAQGEAMACGSVPIATAQLGMAHFGHQADPIDGPQAPTATGFAVNRSFREDDPELADALAERIREAVRLYRDDPAGYARLSRNAAANARAFTWDRCAAQHVDHFEGLWGTRGPADDADKADAADRADELALKAGWFDRLSPGAWTRWPDRVAERALAVGDIEAFARVRPVDDTAARQLFEAAHARADFAACAAVLRRTGRTGPEADLLRARCRTGEGPDGRWVEYRLPQAARVDLVLPRRGPDPAAVRLEPEVVPLVPHGDGDSRTFRARLGRPVRDEALHLLLTLNTGRVTWDRIDLAEEGRDA
ncbi:glycogen/starch synthase [Streptomyces polygonati]|uniref:D-inositol 3-phosphate glycosyltransferase n=1 Tax=Streptomyces polygonati TaxID=1617087 RepID=A0ABV8HFX6_9ACTN